MYVAGQTGRIFSVLAWGALPLAVLSARYLWDGWQKRDDAKEKFEKLKKESKTVATLAAK